MRVQLSFVTNSMWQYLASPQRLSATWSNWPELLLADGLTMGRDKFCRGGINSFLALKHCNCAMERPVTGITLEGPHATQSSLPLWKEEATPGLKGCKFLCPCGCIYQRSPCWMCTHLDLELGLILWWHHWIQEWWYLSFSLLILFFLSFLFPSDFPLLSSIPSVFKVQVTKILHIWSNTPWIKLRELFCCLVSFQLHLHQENFWI